MAAHRAVRMLEGVHEHVDTDWLIETAALRPTLRPYAGD
jgi:hypothetical protein